MNLKKYNEILAKIKNKPLNLLLGNGFNINLDQSFKKLSDLETNSSRHTGLETQNDKNKMSEIRDKDTERYFNELAKGTLSYSSSLGEIYKIKPSPNEESTLSLILHRLLAVHPYDASSIREEEASICIDFLRPYLNNGKVFTINYDMLLLWAVVRAYENKELSEKLPEYNDGFTLNKNGMQYWKKTPKQNVFYCHGALDIEPDNRDVFKRRFEQMTLLSINRRSLFSDFSNCVLVSDPTSKGKVKQIEKYDYLKSCIKEFKKLSGSLVIIGVSFQNDDHILDEIKKAQQKSGLNIFYGVLDINDAKNKENLLNEKGIKNITFFDVNTAPIWRKQLS